MNPLTQAAGIDPELEALMQRRAELEQGMNAEAQAIESISTPKPRQDYIQMSGNLPTLSQMYGVEDEPFSPPSYEDTEEDTTYLPSGVTSYEELEAEMSANPLTQVAQNYGRIISGGIPDAETIIPGALMTYGAVAGVGPQDSSIRKQSQIARNKLTEFERIEGDRKGQKKNSTMSRFLKQNGITEEMIDGADGANRGEKVRNAVQNKFRKSLGMKTLNALSLGKYGKDEPTPEPEESGKKKKKSKEEKKAEAEERVKADAKSNRMANLKSFGTAAALAPAVYGIGEAGVNAVFGGSLEDEAAKQAEVYNSNMVMELKQKMAAIDRYISTSKNEAGKIKAGEDRARLLQLLKNFE